MLTRRNFIAGTTAAAIAVNHPFAAAAKEKRFKKAVKIGMVQVDGTLTEKCQVLKDLGFDGLELNAPGGPSADEVLKARETTGIDIHGVVDSVHWRDTLSHPDAAVRKKGLDALKQAIRDAKAYKATSVLLVPAKVDAQATYEQCWERSIPEIKKALPLAEDLDIHVLIENVWNDFLTDPKETARYIDELDSPKAGAYYDVGNSVRYAKPVEWVRALGKRIVKLDIKEYDLSKGKDKGWYEGFKVKLLDGTCDWPDVMAELKKIGFSGWGTAEIPGGGKERLAEIAERMDRIYAS